MADAHIPTSAGSASISPEAKPTDGSTRREFVATGALAAAAFMIVPRHVLGKGQTAPSDRLNIAVVGINGMGAANAQAVMSENIVAICDVDTGLLEGKLASWQRAIEPRPAAPARGGGGGGGNRQAPPPPPKLDFQEFGPSRLQQEADQKWRQATNDERLRGFVTEQMPRLKRYQDYREMLEQQKDIDGVIVATPDHMHAPIASAAMAAGKHVYTEKPFAVTYAEAKATMDQAEAAGLRPGDAIVEIDGQGASYRMLKLGE